MKFGKQILLASTSSTSVCREEMWLDYKRLKKLIKRIPPRDEEGVSSSSDQETLLKGSEVERRFFMMLRRELKKVANCYKELEHRALGRLVKLKSRQAKDANTDRENGYVDLINQCTAVHMELLMLENYAVLNYAGFTKILKKHDKITGFHTKDKFLLKLVNSQPFVVHPWLRSAIRSVEELFMVISRSTPKTPREPKRARTDTTSSQGSRSSSRSASPEPSATAAVASAADNAPAQQQQPQQPQAGSSDGAGGARSTLSGLSLLHGATRVVGEQAQGLSSATVAQLLAQRQHLLRMAMNTTNGLPISTGSSLPTATVAPGLTSSYASAMRSLVGDGAALPSIATSPRSAQAKLSTGGSILPDIILNTNSHFHQQLFHLHSVLERDQSQNWLLNALQRASMFQPDGNTPAGFPSAVGSNSDSGTSLEEEGSGGSPMGSAGGSPIATRRGLSSSSPLTITTNPTPDQHNVFGARAQGQSTSPSHLASSVSSPFSLTRTLDTLALMAQQSMQNDGRPASPAEGSKAAASGLASSGSETGASLLALQRLAHASAAIQAGTEEPDAKRRRM